MREGDQLVRRLPHRGEDADDAVPGLARRDEPARDRLDLLRVGDRRAAELHHDGAEVGGGVVAGDLGTASYSVVVTRDEYRDALRLAIQASASALRRRARPGAPVSILAQQQRERCRSSARPRRARPPGSGGLRGRDPEQVGDEPSTIRPGPPAVQSRGRPLGTPSRVVERAPRRSTSRPAESQRDRVGAQDERAHISRRPASARPSVTSSAYSRSPPTGSPLASRVTRTRSRSRSAR